MSKGVLKQVAWTLIFLVVLAGAVGGIVYISANPTPTVEWQPITPPEPDMECWSAWHGDARVVVCRW